MHIFGAEGSRQNKTVKITFYSAFLSMQWLGFSSTHMLAYPTQFLESTDLHQGEALRTDVFNQQLFSAVRTPSADCVICNAASLLSPSSGWQSTAVTHCDKPYNPSSKESVTLTYSTMTQSYTSQHKQPHPQSRALPSQCFHQIICTSLSIQVYDFSLLNPAAPHTTNLLWSPAVLCPWGESLPATRAWAQPAPPRSVPKATEGAVTKTHSLNFSVECDRQMGDTGCETCSSPFQQAHACTCASYTWGQGLSEQQVPTYRKHKPKQGG